MKRLQILLTVFVLAMPARVAAQSTTFGPTYVQTFYGCAPGISCHFVTLNWSYNASGWAVGTVRAQSWFGMNPWGAGYPWRLFVSTLPYPNWTGQREEYWTSGNTMREYVDETWQYSSDGLQPWNLQVLWVGMQLSYGLPAGQPGQGPYGAMVQMTATPEPASLLLLGTGLLGIGAAARRRKKVKAA